MTDEEMAEEYYYKTYPVTLNIGEEERKKEVTDIFLAGLKAGRPKWHDLRKDPNDLPPLVVGSDYLSEDVSLDAGIIGWYNYNQKKWCANIGYRLDKPVVAWCEISKYTEDEND